MSQIEKISIALPADMLGQIKSVVESGEYATTSEVVREALRDWGYKRQLAELKLQELRRLIQVGIDSGPGIPADEVFASILAEIEALPESGAK